MNENKKNNPEAELNDEALDAVTGGAFYQYNEETKKYDVISRKKEHITSCDTEEEARIMAMSYTNAEAPKYNIYDLSSAYTRNP